MMKNKIFPCLLLLSLLFLLAGPLPAARVETEELPNYTIALLTDGPLAAQAEMVKRFKKEIKFISEGEFSVRFPEKFTVQGDGTAPGISRQFDRLLADPQVNLVIPLGPIGSALALKKETLPKPIIAPFVIDAVLQHAPMKDGGSGVTNLTYIDLKTSIDRQVITFRRITPVKSIAFLLDERDLKGIPEIQELIHYIANEHTLDLKVISVRNSAAETVKTIPAGVDGVMVGPLWQMDEKEFKALCNGLIQRRLPSFSIWDRRYVELGLLAGDRPASVVGTLARRTAVSVQEIVSGEDAARLRVAFSLGTQTTINMATARAIDIYPSLAMMTGATLLHEQRTDIKRKLNIQQAVSEALASNLDLISAEHAVREGDFSVKETRSSLLPQVGVETGARTIDSDRASAAQGSMPENAWTGSVTGSQQIYSEKSWADYFVEQQVQTGRIMARNRIRLNVTHQAAVAYLNVLRAKNIELLYKNNLKLTRENLDRARIRVSTGVAGPDELYRWQTQFANDRQAVLRKESLSMSAMEALNRILARPLQELFVAEETDLNDPLLIAGDRFFFRLVDNPKYFMKFRSIAVARALQHRPELKAYDAAIAAGERMKTASRRSFWLPDFTVEGSVDQYFSDGGSGQRDESTSGLDDTEWTIGVFARLPLFEGGRKSAALGRSDQKIQRLRTEKRSGVLRISQEVLEALNRVRASYPGISLSREAADAASRNLKLIADSYVQGTKSIIELLDAQNQSLTTEQKATNAVYDFLVDLMGVEQAMGEFVTFQPKQQRTQWLEDVRKELFSASGGQGR